MNKETLEFFLKIDQISNVAFVNAQKENQKLGLPNVYANRKGVYFELPDGTITTKNPLER